MCGILIYFGVGVNDRDIYHLIIEQIEISNKKINKNKLFISLSSLGKSNSINRHKYFHYVFQYNFQID